MYFSVQDVNGENFDFSLSINPKMQRYHDILRALEVEPDEQGFMHPPADVVGMKFRGEIIQRQAQNDKTKKVNDVRNLRPLIKGKDTKAQFPDAAEDPGGEDVPF